MTEDVRQNPNPRLVRRRQRRRTTGTVEPGMDFSATWERVKAREIRSIQLGRGTPTPDANSPLVRGMRALIRDRSIFSIIDVGCGDMDWWEHVLGDAEEGEIQFLGIDISSQVIRANLARYRGRKDRHFKVADGRVADLPEVDLVVCRRVLNHLWFTDAALLRRNIARRAHLVALTHDPTLRTNAPDGTRHAYAPDCPRATEFTPMNLRRPPYMPMPVVTSLEDMDDQLLSFFPGRAID